LETQTFELLQFPQIKEQVTTYAISESGKERIRALVPSTNKRQIEGWLVEVSEAKGIINKSSSIPIHGLKGIQQILKSFNKGMALRPDQLLAVHELIDCAEKLRRFMKDKEFIAPKISSFVYSLFDLSELSEEITRCIRNGRVDDYASKELLKTRKQIAVLEERIKDRIEKTVRSSKYSKYIQENIISTRNGRFVIAVKAEYKRNVKGTILDTSASGATVYIEPEEIGGIQEEIYYLKMAEESEEEQVLLYLTGKVEKHENEIITAVETMVHYDVVFAKAKYSFQIEGEAAQINEHHVIKLIEARHPLLGNAAVPLSLEIGSEYDALVITGPNTGGKTVTIKTVGLLTLMAQAGLHIPAKMGSEIAIFKQILVDIGDGQSIEQSLSTFSSRIKNIINILSETNPFSLVLLDELGSGTDPAEGMGLATSILEELYKKGATLLATTHYSEIKEYAKHKEGFENGSMEFDLDTLKPTYRLIVGKGGESQAFAIALKLGMHPKLVERAHEITYKEQKSYELNVEESFRQREQQLALNSKYVKKQKHPQIKQNQEKLAPEFSVGDNVRIPYLNDFGIVYQPSNEKGDVVVIVKGEKLTINQKRLELNIKVEELYPEDYDMDIVFESKENRKKDKLMQKKHIEGLKIERSTE
jgi:DNA mismatch repair protein MutS2